MTDAASPAEFVALIWTRGELLPWVPSIVRTLRAPGLGRLVVSTTANADTSLVRPDPRLTFVVGGHFSAELSKLAHESKSPILVVTAPVLLPEVGIEPALDILAHDIRVVTVSFLSNAASQLSFPNRNVVNKPSIDGHDETSLTRRLREIAPVLLPVPIAVPAGAATLMSRDCVVVNGGTSGEFDSSPEVAIAELALRAGRRGFRSVLDPSTYLSRPLDGQDRGTSGLDDKDVRSRLRNLHPFFPSLHDRERRSPNSPLGLALSVSRAKVKGLRILVDASCLGPIENGTQVQTLALIDALARRHDVEWVGAGLSGPVPRYAETQLYQSKVRILPLTGMRFNDIKADVLHRPYQPARQTPWNNWREVATRVVVTIQDLIAYANGAYHDEPKAWHSYRAAVAECVTRADGTVVISHDVADDIRRERLPVAPDRLFVVENGTAHLSGEEPEVFPGELAERGWAARPFMVVLGADYSHKNRDLAVQVLERVQTAFPSMGLVLAGVSVAKGSSRALEALVSQGVDDVVTLPDVTSEERNWLLRHAEICLYPTSAEGFGLVPFEAAHFGTPTVFAHFGPLAEVLANVPVAASSWDPEALSSACLQLLADPQLASEQVAAILKNSSRYNWDRTAELLVEAYRELLAKPSTHSPQPKKKPTEEHNGRPDRESAGRRRPQDGGPREEHRRPRRHFA